jgi:predicted DNA-binding transcriptional regulator AlpA
MDANTNSPSLLKTTLLDSRQAAAYLSCSRQWLAILRMNGAGPAYIKHGAWVRYRVSDLDAWIGQHRVANGELA